MDLPLPSVLRATEPLDEPPPDELQALIERTTAASADAATTVRFTLPPRGFWPGLAAT
jgi:hypothetical protein